MRSKQLLVLALASVAGMGSAIPFSGTFGGLPGLPKQPHQKTSEDYERLCLAEAKRDRKNAKRKKINEANQ